MPKGPKTMVNRRLPLGLERVRDRLSQMIRSEL